MTDSQIRKAFLERYIVPSYYTASCFEGMIYWSDEKMENFKGWLAEKVSWDDPFNEIMIDFISSYEDWSQEEVCESCEKGQCEFDKWDSPTKYEVADKTLCRECWNDWRVENMIMCEACGLEEVRNSDGYSKNIKKEYLGRCKDCHEAILKEILEEEQDK